MAQPDRTKAEKIIDFYFMQDRKKMMLKKNVKK
jgi:hypothetical protein